MLNRLIKNTWDLESFIKEIQDKHLNTFTEEALEVIFDKFEDYPGYCCIEELTEDFEEWTYEKFASFINDKYQENITPEKVGEFVYREWNDDGEISHSDIIRILKSTVLIHPDFGLYNS